MIRTRFAPSPTGYLHIGGARTALFSWAYTRRNQGKFILRIEDTDLERSTPESVQAILDGMNWLGLDYDEGPFYQMQRMDRYREVIAQLLRDDHAYYCYCTKERLEEVREQQRATGLKPKYDGHCRHLPEALKSGMSPVVRFKNPLDGEVVIDDLIKGTVIVNNQELDDLIIARADGTPTYNFCVVVDDWDMQITHVIRGDDHLNNTPRQINILRALNASVPQYAHVPMILGADGERLSKRHGAVSVMQYKEEGYLPEALLNYLARLSWAHGDDEIFSMQQFVDWFDLSHVSKSPAKFNPEKLLWLNQQYIKQTDNARLADLGREFFANQDVDVKDGPALETVVDLLKERASTIEELARSAVYFYRDVVPEPELLEKHVPAAIRPILSKLVTALETVAWERDAIHALLQQTVKENNLAFPKIAMPLRVLATGGTQTPSIDQTLELIGREAVLRRLKQHLSSRG